MLFFSNVAKGRFCAGMPRFTRTFGQVARAALDFCCIFAKIAAD
jgi:hypothetical protein